MQDFLVKMLNSSITKNKNKISIDLIKTILERENIEPTMNYFIWTNVSVINYIII